MLILIYLAWQHGPERAQWEWAYVWYATTVYQHVYSQYWGTWPIPLDLTTPEDDRRKAIRVDWHAQTMESPNTEKLPFESTRHGGRPIPEFAIGNVPEKAVDLKSHAECASTHEEVKQSELSENQAALVDHHKPTEHAEMSRSDANSRSSTQPTFHSPQSGLVSTDAAVHLQSQYPGLSGPATYEQTNLLETFEFFQPSIFIPRNFIPEQYFLQPLWYDSSAEYEIPKMSLSQLASSDEDKEFHPLSKMDRKIQRDKRLMMRAEFLMRHGFPYNDPRAAHVLPQHRSSGPSFGQQALQNIDVRPRGPNGYLRHEPNTSVAPPLANTWNPSNFVSDNVQGHQISMNTALDSRIDVHSQTAKQRSNLSQHPEERWLKCRSAPISGKVHHPHASFLGSAGPPVFSRTPSQEYGPGYHPRRGSPYHGPPNIGLEHGRTHTSSVQTAQDTPLYESVYDARGHWPAYGFPSYDEQSSLGLESRASSSGYQARNSNPPSYESRPPRQPQSIAERVNDRPEDLLAQPSAYSLKPQSPHSREAMHRTSARGFSDFPSHFPDRRASGSYEQMHPQGAPIQRIHDYHHSEAPMTGVYPHIYQRPMPMNQHRSVPGQRRQSTENRQRSLNTSGPIPHDPAILQQSSSHYLEDQNVPQSYGRQVTAKGHPHIDGEWHVSPTMYPTPERGPLPVRASSHHLGKSIPSRGKPWKYGWSPPKKGSRPFNWNSPYHHVSIPNYQRVTAGASYGDTHIAHNERNLNPELAQRNDDLHISHRGRRASENSAQMGHWEYNAEHTCSSSPDRMVTSEPKGLFPDLAIEESMPSTSQQGLRRHHEPSIILKVGDKDLEYVKNQFGSSEMAANEESTHSARRPASVEPDRKTESPVATPQLQTVHDEGSWHSEAQVCAMKVDDADLAPREVAIQTDLEAPRTKDAAAQTYVEAPQTRDAATQTDAQSPQAEDVAIQTDTDASQQRVAQNESSEEGIIGLRSSSLASEVIGIKSPEVNAHSKQVGNASFAKLDGIEKFALETGDAISSEAADGFDVTQSELHHTASRPAEVSSLAKPVSDTYASKAAKAVKHNISKSPAKDSRHGKLVPETKADNTSTRDAAFDTVSWTESPCLARSRLDSASRAMILEASSYGNVQTSIWSTTAPVKAVETPPNDAASPVSQHAISPFQARTEATGINPIHLDHKPDSESKTALDEKNLSLQPETEPGPGHPSGKVAAINASKDAKVVKQYEELKRKEAGGTSKKSEPVMVAAAAQNETAVPSDNMGPIITRKKRQKKKKPKTQNAGRTEQSPTAEAQLSETEGDREVGEAKTPSTREKGKGKAGDDDWKARYLPQRCTYQ